jgi:mRNA interferase YafQ
MRTIRYTSEFQEDFKREEKTHQKKLRGQLDEVIKMLADDEVLPHRYKDHPLVDEWQDHRDCHIEPDLVLIYRKPDDTILELVRLGSHSELFEP